MKRLNLFLVSLLFLGSCKSGKEKDIQELSYYDIKGFFEQEIVKLNKTNPVVKKSVFYNQDEEVKTLKIKDWAQELSLFVESDINKSSWKNSYKIDSLPNQIVYTAKENDLRTQKIIIDFKDSKPVKFSIKNKSINYLYTTSEDLTFYTDSLYNIVKDQHVTVLGDNHYIITGLLVR
ncbi:hypothetical protein Pedsa_2037 [Pseudopedobacter saltans DSM 12145]|uniref:Uncharacterized protein n=1 Tax=Pseudopedobacter saltans (strain ATCC 51119 / DSM 12145 / JCM 21818 / CCUG 39354 / LMG 10337 / NBRC 100064 / NCIMB 13643) TaxID=762903 RepID=F0SAG9_PSESL|nr:hypothetical protein [Pseudopedobacter saltans]ADY52589.1 hypothetical protein Pedsa_2037 [Pseudopedobacter saltans DSM 12145]